MSAESSSNAPAASEAAQPHSGSIRLVIGSIAALLLLASLDQTIVSTALPTIVAELGALEHLSWVVTAYILASTVSAPLYGKLGDLYGRRNMVFVSVGLFLAGSALAGAAMSMQWLIVSRAIQGLGGGGLFVLALSVIGDVIPPQDRGKVQGVFASIFSVSSVIGPLIGGFFTEQASWHWIFYINIPIGAAALAGFAASFKPTGQRTKHRIDWAGAAALSLALTGITLATSLGGRTFGWGSPQILGLAALAVLATLAFLWIEARAAEPILPLSLFRLNVFWVTSIIGFIAGAAMFGAVTFLPVYLQIAKGATPTMSGLMLIPMTAGILLSSTFAGQYMGRTGRYKILPFLGMGALMIGMALLSTLGANTHTVLFAIFLAFVGLGMGNIFPVVTTAVQAAVPRHQLGTATASGLMFRQIGGSLAVAGFGALFTARLAGQSSGALDAFGGAEGFAVSPAALAQLPQETRAEIATLVVHAIHPIFLVAAGLALVGFLTAFALTEVRLHNRMVPKGE
ncbi:MAG: MFS transporter [Maritimibacter sp.]|nr:MFS transporter [Maritimibacter sp.]